MSRKPTARYNLANKHPTLVMEWSSKNLRAPAEYTPSSGAKVWWKCKAGHEWEAAIYSRSKNGRGCPYCANQRISSNNSLAVRNPTLAKEWHATKNGKVKPSDVFPNSQKKYWWVCPLGHDYQATPNNRSHGKGCSFCNGVTPTKGSSAADLYPALLKEYSSKNEKPLSTYKPRSNKKVWWTCSAGHDWQAVISSRSSNGVGCPYCKNRLVADSNSLAAVYPELLEEWDYEKNGTLTPHDVLWGSSQEVYWKCKRGHSFFVPVARRTHEGRGCSKCTGHSSRSELRFFAETAHVFTDVRHRYKIAGTEADIFIPSLSLAVEYDGAYYHKTMLKRDREKNRVLKDAGVTLIRLRERSLKLLGPNDVQIHEVKHLRKSDVDTLMMKILEVAQNATTSVRRTIEAYIKKKSFRADAHYHQLLQAVPGPSEIKNSVAANIRISAEWNYERNAPLRPEQIHKRSGMKVWWKCNKSHEWQATVDKRTSGRNCPYCSNKRIGYGNSLADVAPDVAKEWYQLGNGDITPSMVTAGSYKKVWWICSNGHKFRTAVVGRVRRRTGCKHCPGIGKNKPYTEPNI
jgi:very-short-patch-repair endonuclease/cytochrome c-type biogenesis protein CcmH/NrfF